MEREQITEHSAIKGLGTYTILANGFKAALGNYKC